MVAIVQEDSCCQARDTSELEVHLDRDLRDAAALLSRVEARYLVDMYYVLQEVRKRANNQQSAMKTEPHALLSWVGDRMEKLEASIRSALRVYARAHTVGKWSQSIIGIGPVLSAGLLAHIDIQRAPTAGHIWNFAGLNPGQRWLGTKGGELLMRELWPKCGNDVDRCLELASQSTGISTATLRMWATVSPKGEPRALSRTTLTAALARRPWNEDLKVLCWKLGESFVKSQASPQSYYGPLYVQRRRLEDQQNEAGAFAEQAAYKLATTDIGKDTEAYKWYSQGKLPPAHVYQRSKRWVVKLFLSHWHSVAFQARYRIKPAVPYAIAHLGHAHLIEPPNWPMEPRRLNSKHEERAIACEQHDGESEPRSANSMEGERAKAPEQQNARASH